MISEAAEEELVALRSIYEDISIDVSHRQAILRLPVSAQVPPDKQICIHQRDSVPTPLGISHLPPLLLEAVLDHHYPNRAPQINLGSSWVLSPIWLERLRERLLALWTPGDAVIFSMIDLIQFVLEDEPSRIELQPSPTYNASRPLDQFLLDHHSNRSTELFSNQSFLCSICLEPQKGKRCVELACHHVFCVACLHAYFSLSIHEGLVNSNICCPNCKTDRADALKKDSSTPEAALPGHIPEDTLISLVGKELFDRYVWLIDKQRWESDPTISFCPRENCQAAVPKESNNEAYVKLRTCPKCGFSFCVLCKRTWHGSHVPCRVSHADSLVGRYLAATEEEQAFLEKQYGAAIIKKLVDSYLEDQANQEWKDANTTACPNCSVPVEKSAGCSHMTCQKCHRHFCFRCGIALAADRPYLHFSDSKTGCYGKLFDYEPEQEEEANWRAIIGLVADGL